MSHLKREFALVVDERELATILAALRFHQDENLRIGPDIPDQAIKDIVTDCGSFEPLDFDDVNRLCERINLGVEVYTHRRRQVWILMVMDNLTVIHVCAYNSKILAEKTMLSFLRNHWGYTGQDNISQAREWIAGHCSALRVEICPIHVDCSTGLRKGTDSKCNWCGNAIGAEDIKWRGVRFCSDTCLDECRAAQ